MSPTYHLETIPVWDALRRGSECLLCDLEEGSESRNVDFFLGASIMAPEMRVELNKHGFCPRHFHMLEAGTGKLGYSLALSTHMEDLAERVDRSMRRLAGAGPKRSAAGARDLAVMLENQGSDCLMCDRVNHNLRNYAYTVVKLFQTDIDFRKAFVASPGVCFHHLPLLLRMGVSVLPPADLPAWHSMLRDLVAGAARRLARQLEAFSWQFDATTERSTPDEARDAVPRSVRKLAGIGSTSQAQP